MSALLRTWLAATEGTATQAVVLVLVDTPGLTPAAVEEVLAAAGGSGSLVGRPTTASLGTRFCSGATTAPCGQIGRRRPWR
jgi:CTP:molybdopterin cytidylyltransferase MocA